jgi:hypothetical protein
MDRLRRSAEVDLLGIAQSRMAVSRALYSETRHFRLGVRFAKVASSPMTGFMIPRQFELMTCAAATQVLT